MRSSYRLAAIYSVFDGEELLAGSIATLREHVDIVLVVVQSKSNLGEVYGGGVDRCRRLQAEGLVDIVEYFEPPQNCPPQLSERHKRQQGIEIARRVGCTHFLHVDCDEYYVPRQFQAAWQSIQSRGEAGTACRTITYIRRPFLQLEGFDDLYVPFIHRIEQSAEFTEAIPSWSLDPTRTIRGVRLTEIPSDLLVMHHFSLVRLDLARKLRNSTCMYSPGYISEVVRDVQRVNPGDVVPFQRRRAVCIVLPDFGRKALRELNALDAMIS